MTPSSMRSAACSSRLRFISRWIWLALVLLPLAASGAEFSRAVIAQFKGQLLVFAEFPETTGADSEIIAHLKAARLNELKGEPGADDTTHWSMKFIAFPQVVAAGKLKIEFHESGRFAADYLLPDLPTHAASYEFAFTIGEDDGLRRGKKYTIKLVDLRDESAGPRDRVLATTSLFMK